MNEKTDPQNVHTTFSNAKTLFVTYYETVALIQMSTNISMTILQCQCGYHKKVRIEKCHSPK